MATQNVSHQNSANKPQTTRDTGQSDPARLHFVALMIHLVSMYDREPEKSLKKEHRVWKMQLQKLWDEAVLAVFPCFPKEDGDGFQAIPRGILENLLIVAQDCVKGGMIYQRSGARKIIN